MNKLRRVPLLSPFLLLCAVAAPQAGVGIATRQEPSIFLRVNQGKTALLRDRSGRGLGTIFEHLIDRASGLVTHVIVDPLGFRGDKLRVRVPFADFEFDEREQTLRLPLSLAKLRDYPAWVPSPVGDVDGTPRVAPATLRAGTVLKRSVWARGSRFGTIRALVMDSRTGRLVFLLVDERLPATVRTALAVPSEPFVVPFGSTTWRVGDAPGQGGVELGHTALDLVRAPRLGGGDLRALGSKSVLADIHRFFGTRRSAKL